MGVSISYEFLQREKHIEKTLDRTEKFAEQVKELVLKKLGISMMIRRFSKYQLLVDIKGCETLTFDFVKTEKMEDWQKDYSILYREARDKNQALVGHAERMKTHSVDIDVIGNEILIARAFCKTQYGSDVAHKIVCDILKFAAQQCYGAIVNDEADYYYSQNISDATIAKKETAEVLEKTVEKLTGKSKNKGK